MSLPNNGNGFGANSASLVAYRTRDTLNSAENFQHLAEASQTAAFVSYSVDIPDGAAVLSYYNVGIPSGFLLLGATVSNPTSTTTYTIYNAPTAGGANALVLTGGANGAFTNGGVTAGNATSTTGFRVVIGVAAQVGATSVILSGLRV